MVPVSSRTSSVEDAGYNVAFSSLGITPRVSACHSSFSNATLSADVDELGIDLRLYHAWDLPIVTVDLGVSLGASLFRQTFHTPGFARDRQTGVRPGTVSVWYAHWHAPGLTRLRHAARGVRIGVQPKQHASRGGRSGELDVPSAERPLLRILHAFRSGRGGRDTVFGPRERWERLRRVVMSDVRPDRQRPPRSGDRELLRSLDARPPRGARAIRRHVLGQPASGRSQVQLLRLPQSQLLRGRRLPLTRGLRARRSRCRRHIGRVEVLDAAPHVARRRPA